MIPFRKFKKSHTILGNIVKRMMNLKDDSQKIVEIVEGTAKMYYNTEEAVFYNKVQVLNRDLSIQIINLFSEKYISEYNFKIEEKLKKNPTFEVKKKDGIHLLDALAATGLRSIRYINEVPSIKKITINDLSSEAIKAAKDNCLVNNVDLEKVELENKDAVLLMIERKCQSKYFDVIDLDPYGAASPFLDAAVQVIANGGLICVTCTDLSVLSGSYPETCFAKYGVIPIKARFFHEMSLRILLHSIDAAANRYGKYIVPWVSISVDFYVRVFVRVFESKHSVKDSCLRRIMVYQSTQCPSFYIQPYAQRNVSKRKRGDQNEESISTTANGSYSAAKLSIPSKCEETNANFKVGGPFWGDPIFDPKIIQELINRVEQYKNKYEAPKNEEESKLLLKYPIPTFSRLYGLLIAISEELNDIPLYYSLPELASTLRSTVPTLLEFKSALVNAGFRASHFHHEPSAVKTDAPPNIVWDILRAYCKINPPKRGKSNKKGFDIVDKILSNPSSIEVDFSIPKEMDQNKIKVARFPPNPEPNWGPKRKAGRKIDNDTDN